MKVEQWWGDTAEVKPFTVPLRPPQIPRS